MSVHGILDAMHSDLNFATRLVWQCLENHANGHRFWRISLGDIAAELHMNRDTVLHAVQELETEQIIRAERRRRYAPVFHMLRSYPEEGKTKGKKAAHKPGVNGELTAELMPEIPAPSPELMPEIPAPSPELTNQLMPEIPAPNPPLTTELMPEIPASLKYVSTSKEESNRGNPSPSPVRTDLLGTPDRSDARVRNARRSGGGQDFPLPDDWKPNRKHFELGATLGLDSPAVFTEADNMRDWAAHKGAVGRDWDARFRAWLRAEGKAVKARGPRPVNGQASAPRQSAYDANARNLAAAIERACGRNPLDHLEEAL